MGALDQTSVVFPQFVSRETMLPTFSLPGVPAMTHGGLDPMNPTKL